MEEITLADAIEYPIWEWALDGEHIPGQDETWQQPILNTTDVTDAMCQPIITLRFKETGEYASAEYNLDEDIIESIAVWENDEWISVFDKEGMAFPVVLVAVPTIKGEANVEFVYKEWTDETAGRIKE